VGVTSVGVKKNPGESLVEGSAENLKNFIKISGILRREERGVN
jgi:hypothetical protein